MVGAPKPNVLVDVVVAAFVGTCTPPKLKPPVVAPLERAHAPKLSPVLAAAGVAVALKLNPVVVLEALGAAACSKENPPDVADSCF